MNSTPREPAPLDGESWRRLLGDEVDRTWFVGGCVRDLLLDVRPVDLDLAVAGDASVIGARLSRRLQLSCFWLHEELGILRLAARDAEAHVDIARIVGENIEEDLRRRDLTINSMGIACRHGLSAAAPLLDPAGGRADLDAGVLRFTTAAAPREDPLRVLRLFRFQSALGFHPVPEALELAAGSAPALDQVAGERIREELFRLLDGDDPAAALQGLLGAGGGARVLGRPGPGVAGPVAAVVSRAVRRLEGLPSRLAAFLGEAPGAGVTRRGLLLWLAAFKGAGGERAGAADLASSLAFSACVRREALQTLDALHVEESHGDQSRLWAAHTARPAGAATGLLLGWLLSPEDEPLPAALDTLLEWRLNPPRPLIDGAQMIADLGLEPGPRIGALTRGLLERQATGEIDTREAAMEWLRAAARYNNG